MAVAEELLYVGEGALYRLLGACHELALDRQSDGRQPTRAGPKSAPYLAKNRSLTDNGLLELNEECCDLPQAMTRKNFPRKLQIILVRSPICAATPSPLR